MGCDDKLHTAGGASFCVHGCFARTLRSGRRSARNHGSAVRQNQGRHCHFGRDGGGSARRINRHCGGYCCHHGIPCPPDDASQKLSTGACHRRNHRFRHAGADHTAVDYSCHFRRHHKRAGGGAFSGGGCARSGSCLFIHHLYRCYFVSET